MIIFKNIVLNVVFSFLFLIFLVLVGVHISFYLMLFLLIALPFLPAIFSSLGDIISEFMMKREIQLQWKSLNVAGLKKLSEKILAKYSSCRNGENILGGLGSLLEAAALTSPSNGQIWNYLGRTYHELGRTQAFSGKHAPHISYGKAIDAYRKAVDFLPVTQDMEFVSILHSNLGYALKESGKLGEAIIHLEQAIKLNPNNQPAAVCLAEIVGDKPYFQTTRAEELLEKWDRKRIEPSHSLIKARIFSANREFDKAIACIKDDIKHKMVIDPKYLFELGNLYHQKGRPLTAVFYWLLCDWKLIFIVIKLLFSRRRAERCQK